MRYGLFLPPFHAIDENPTLAFERDLQLLEALDRMGYDEAWIGEHHSGGWETITDPAVFIGVASQRTKRIMLGTGVTSLPYHHPLNVADRMTLLDHLTRGRVMLGVGPGALPSDAAMMGIDHSELRTRMDESLGCILRLLAGETFSHKSHWFELDNARIHVLPYTKPRFPVVVACVQTPSGPTVAGRHGVSLLAIGSTVFGGLGDYKDMWDTAQAAATEAGNVMVRDDWRIVMPIYIADSRKEAMRDVTDGFRRVEDEYIGRVVGIPHRAENTIDGLVERDLAIIGSPDDAVESIKRLEEASGGFGTLLGIGYEWTSHEKLLKSYEMFARYVMPQFQGSLVGPVASADLVASQAAEINQRRAKATIKAFEDGGRTMSDEARRAVGLTQEN